jgi:hypothetical protein
MNINDVVLVKLTDVGVAALKHEHDVVWAGYPSPPAFSPPPADNEGFVKFQLWELMSKFGRYTVFSAMPPIETEIRLLGDGGSQ